MLKYMALLFCISLAGLFYVYEEVEAVKIGYTIRKQEETKVLWLDHARALKYNRAHLESSNYLEKQLAAERIQLEAPKAWETLVIYSGHRVNSKPGFAASIRQAAFFNRFFMGTAQAEANDSTTH